MEAAVQGGGCCTTCGKGARAVRLGSAPQCPAAGSNVVVTCAVHICQYIHHPPTTHTGPDRPSSCSGACGVSHSYRTAGRTGPSPVAAATRIRPCHALQRRCSPRGRPSKQLARAGGRAGPAARGKGVTRCTDHCCRARAAAGRGSSAGRSGCTAPRSVQGGGSCASSCAA